MFVGGCSGKWVWCGVFVSDYHGKWVGCICVWLPYKMGGVYLWVVTVENGWGVFQGGYSVGHLWVVTVESGCGVFEDGFIGKQMWCVCG